MMMKNRNLFFKNQLKVIPIVLFLLMALFISSHVSANDTATSEASVTFIGVPPQPPKKEEQPKPAPKKEPVKAKRSGFLPHTGEEFAFWFSMVGFLILLIVLLGSIYNYLKKKTCDE